MLSAEKLNQLSANDGPSFDELTQATSTREKYREQLGTVQMLSRTALQVSLDLREQGYSYDN